jgi:nitrogen fixation/metabolism regulation signal transduction histidine kinase
MKKLERISKKIVYYIGLLILSILSLLCFYNTSILNNNEHTKITTISFNIIIFIVIFFLLYLLIFKLVKQKVIQKNKKIIIPIILVIYVRLITKRLYSFPKKRHIHILGDIIPLIFQLI